MCQRRAGSRPSRAGSGRLERQLPKRHARRTQPISGAETREPTRTGWTSSQPSPWDSRSQTNWPVERTARREASSAGRPSCRLINTWWFAPLLSGTAFRTAVAMDSRSNNNISGQRREFKRVGVEENIRISFVNATRGHPLAFPYPTARPTFFIDQDASLLSTSTPSARVVPLTARSIAAAGGRRAMAPAPGGHVVEPA